MNVIFSHDFRPSKTTTHICLETTLETALKMIEESRGVRIKGNKEGFLTTNFHLGKVSDLTRLMFLTGQDFLDGHKNTKGLTLKQIQHDVDTKRLSLRTKLKAYTARRHIKFEPSAYMNVVDRGSGECAIYMVKHNGEDLAEGIHITDAVYYSFDDTGPQYLELSRNCDYVCTNLMLVSPDGEIATPTFVSSSFVKKHGFDYYPKMKG